MALSTNGAGIIAGINATIASATAAPLLHDGENATVYSKVTTINGQVSILAVYDLGVPRNITKVRFATSATTTVGAVTTYNGSWNLHWSADPGGGTFTASGFGTTTGNAVGATVQVTGNNNASIRSRYWCLQVFASNMLPSAGTATINLGEFVLYDDADQPVYTVPVPARPVLAPGTTTELSAYHANIIPATAWYVGIPGYSTVTSTAPNGWLVANTGTAADPRLSVTVPADAGTRYPLGSQRVQGLTKPGTYSVAVEFDLAGPEPEPEPEPILVIAPAEQFGHGVEIRLYAMDAAGIATRRRLPTPQIGECNWTIDSAGGFGDFSLSIAAKPSEFTSIKAGDRLEIFKFGTRQYRGYVGEITRSEEEPATLTLSGYGRILDLERMLLDFVAQRGTIVDLSDLFAEIAAEIQARYPSIVVEAETIGVGLSTLDCRNITAKEALESLVNTAPSLCHYGFDVTDQGRDRLYLRRIDLSESDHTIIIPGDNVGQRSVTTSASDIINSVLVQGGNAKHPQLLPNGSFEVLSSFSSDDGSGAGANLLENNSFEIDTDQNGSEGWTFSGGASAKPNGGEEMASRTGSWAVELDQANEAVSQTQENPVPALVPGRDIVVGCWSRPEVFASLTNPPRATVTLFWRNFSGVFTVAGSFIAQSNLSAWRQYQQTYRCPVGATGFKVQIQKTGGSVGANKGILIDDVYCYDSSGLTAALWDVRPFGSAVVGSINWAAKPAFHGKNCLFLSCVAQDQNGDDIHVRLTPDYRVSVVGGQKFRFNFSFKSIDATTFTPKMLVRYKWFKDDGKEIGDSTTALVPSQLTPDWEFFSGNIQAPGNATALEIYIVIRGSGSFYLDALSLRDFADSNLDYLPEGNYQVRFRSDILISAEENAEVNASIATYGLREGIVSASNVETYEDALTVARGYLLANAGGLPSVSLDLYDDKRPWKIGDTVTLGGTTGAAYSDRILPVVRIGGTIDGNGLLTHSLELSKPVLTDEELIARLAKDKSRNATSTVAVQGASAVSGGTSVQNIAPAGVLSVNSLEDAVIIAGSGGITSTIAGNVITLDGSGIEVAAGVSSVNSLEGAVTIQAGDGIGIAITDSTITLSNTASGSGGTGVLSVSRVDSTGTITGNTDDYFVVITDSSVTSRAIAWSNTSGGHVDSQTILNGKTSGNIVISPGTGNTFANVGGDGTITLAPGQMLRAVAFEDSGTSFWTAYGKII